MTRPHTPPPTRPHLTFLTPLPHLHRPCPCPRPRPPPATCAHPRPTLVAHTQPPAPPPLPPRLYPLSILSLTSLLSAATGAPTLPAWTALFTALGAVTHAPVALIALSTGLCAVITDLIAFDIGLGAYDHGVIPFLLFLAGGVVAAGVEWGASPAALPPPLSRRDGALSGVEDGVADGEFAAWDGELRRRHRSPPGRR